MAKDKATPHPLMPQTLLLSAVTYPDDGGKVHLCLKDANEDWGIFGDGDTLAQAAADLFEIPDKAGGMAAFCLRI